MVKAAAWIAGALLIVLIASYAWGRLRPPTHAQAQAMALLKPVPPPTGAVNAWATFWLLDYDIPAAQIDAVYAHERENLQAWAQRTRADKSPDLSYHSRVGEHFPKRPAISAAQRKQLCHPTDPDCLGKVRANLQPLQALLASQTGRLTQLRAIPPDAVLWDEMPNTPYTPSPDLGPAGSLRLTAVALDFADGWKEQALAQVCRDARTVRHLRARTNSLIGAMVANRWMYPIERLLAACCANCRRISPFRKIAPWHSRRSSPRMSTCARRCNGNIKAGRGLTQVSFPRKFMARNAWSCCCCSMPSIRAA